MGQYFKAYIEKDNEMPIILDPWNFNNGAKLMEHSWLGNDFVNAAYTVIECNPAHVGWIGDYSDDSGCDEKIYYKCWGDDPQKSAIVMGPANRFVENDKIVGKGSLINYSKKEFIDLKGYAIAAIDSYDSVVNPLPLLTAIGNGLGGGDYHASCINFKLVGSWFMDEIEYNPNIRMFPDDYKNITFKAIFKEER